MYRAAIILLLVILSSYQIEQMHEARHKMVVEQIVARGISNPATLNAMKIVARHKFVPASLQAFAYSDQPLSIGYQQTISQPYIVAYMTAALNLSETDKVLEIGTGSGYQAAILGEIVKEVITIEIVKELAESSKTLLKELNYSNIRVIYGDGYKGYPDAAPYDAILVTAAPEKIPPALIEQLKEGGKMIIPVGSMHNTQYLLLVEKKNGEVREQKMLPVRFVPFTREVKY